MAAVLSHQILSPLGLSSAETYQAVRTGQSALRRYDGRWGLPFPFVASLFTDAQWAEISLEGYTRFESLCIRAIRGAVAKTDIDVASQRTVLCISTTKGNIALLEADAAQTENCQEPNATIVPQDEYAGQAAERIARAVGVTTEPIVVCNACISGLHALIVADRLLQLGCYDHAIVCGADVQGSFIIAGFQSLKALSPNPCRPFDIERLGLNLGEAAGAMVLSQQGAAPWQLHKGAVTNDAYHISAPSRKGDGAFAALKAVADGAIPAFINAHGTATMFNDQMESVAIERAGLDNVPVNSLKGYLGHTMGAAGIVETILSMMAADDGIVLPTRGFEERGVSGKIAVNPQHSTLNTQHSTFIKMLSGFGGCNAAAMLTKQPSPSTPLSPEAVLSLPRRSPHLSLHASHRVILRPDFLSLDGKEQTLAGDHAEQLTHLYKTHVDDYPKFYKMDPLSRLGFIAAELLLKAEGDFAINQQAINPTAIVLFSHSSSIVSDRRFLETIRDPQAFYPSPSVFVYTLPNIVTGEIAIRHHITGETAFYLLSHRDDQLMDDILRATFLASGTDTILAGWLDYEAPDHYEADLRLFTLDG